MLWKFLQKNIEAKEQSYPYYNLSIIFYIPNSHLGNNVKRYIPLISDSFHCGSSHSYWYYCCGVECPDKWAVKYSCPSSNSTTAFIVVDSGEVTNAISIIHNADLARKTKINCDRLLVHNHTNYSWGELTSYIDIDINIDIDIDIEDLSQSILYCSSFDVHVSFKS